MSEGAWKSVTSHVSRDTAATIRQAGLHSLTADHVNPHFTHNIHIHVQCTCICIYACTCTCAYTHYGYYTEMVVELVKAKGDRKRGVHVRVVCIVPIHCACVYTYFVLLCVMLRIQIYKISCLHALCVHVVLYGWCVSYYTCLSSHRMETLYWWKQPTGVGLQWLWSWWRRGHCWTCRIQYVPTQLYMMYRNMHTLLLYILKLK